MHDSVPQPGEPTAGAKRGPGCELTLVKGRHTWRFCCDSAEEPLLLSVIAELASRGQAGLDQFDLAVLATQLQEHFACDHEAELLGETGPDSLPLSDHSAQST